MAQRWHAEAYAAEVSAANSTQTSSPPAPAVEPPLQEAPAAPATPFYVQPSLNLTAEEAAQVREITERARRAADAEAAAAAAAAAIAKRADEALAARLPAVYLMQQHVTAAEYVSFLRAADAFVLPTRGEVSGMLRRKIDVDTHDGNLALCFERLTCHAGLDARCKVTHDKFHG